MPKKQENTLSKEPDPYTFEHYPEKFAVKVGRHTHNARQLLRAAVHRARYGAGGPPFQNMYRQPIPDETVDEMFRKTGHVYHDGRWHRRRTMTRARREAARELRRRQGLPVYNDKPHADHGTERVQRRYIPRQTLDSVRRRLPFGETDYGLFYDGGNYTNSSNNSSGMESNGFNDHWRSLMNNNTNSSESIPWYRESPWYHHTNE